MKLNEAFPSNYLKAADLQGRDVVVTISRYEMKKLDGEDKLILNFVGKDKGMVCNKTNAGRIALCFGEDLDNWRGQSIVLGTEFVEYQGRTSEAIRVKGKAGGPSSQAAPIAAPAAPPEQPFNDEITF